jgi:hypothetical protein
VSGGDSQVLNPVQVEAAIVAAAQEVTEGVAVVSQRLQAYRDAERQFDAVWAACYMQAKGPVEERKQACVLATMTEREHLDVCEVSYKYADRRCKAAEARLSAYQSISKSVRAMYGAAGTGDY